MFSLRRDRCADLTVRQLPQYATLILSLSLTLVACNPSPESKNTASKTSPADSNTITIWWNKGYLLEEDEALRQIVRQWESQSGKTVKLSLETEDELPQKIERALSTGNPPDILFSTRAEYELNPRLAWEGKLADVSEVIEPVEDLFAPSVLQAMSLYNKVANKRSYYAVPIYQATIYLHYWRDLVEQAGQKPEDIPKGWDEFWAFWQATQDNLKGKQPEIYSLGFTLSPSSSDTYYLFEQVLEAYDVELVDEEGNLRADDPQVRQGIIQSLDWIAQLYRSNYIPPKAVEWLNPDNNFNMLNRAVVMTPNPTLSIPAAQRQDEEVYFKQLRTLEFPNKPSGEPMRYLVSVRQAVVFAEGTNSAAAKEFLAYLVEPETLTDYLKAATGRYFPVMNPAWDDPFWSDRADPHISTATTLLTERPTRPFAFTRNPAYSQVLDEHIWGKAINRVLVEGVSPEQAADEAIARIQEIFDEWE